MFYRLNAAKWKCPCAGPFFFKGLDEKEIYVCRNGGGGIEVHFWYKFYDVNLRNLNFPEPIYPRMLSITSLNIPFDNNGFLYYVYSFTNL